MKPYLCTCGNTLYFDNSRCLECGKEVGYDWADDQMVEVGPDELYVRCSNGETYNMCNWVMPSAHKGKLCPACLLSRTIPDLSILENRVLWAEMEQAKRHAVYSLLRLELPVIDRRADPKGGLFFDFLRPLPNAPVTTGHDQGIITMNLEEADDALRERNRTALHEPYRTLLGHFRHELGHYYWYLWYQVQTPAPEWINAFREVFGDERVSYSDAMQNYYNQGAPLGWENNFISAYATMHPWEDWAETWANYMHICDGLETAWQFGLEQGVKRRPISLITPDAARLPAPFEDRDPAPFLSMLHRWIRLSPAMNALSKSLGHKNLYPFVLSTPVVKKLHMIDALIKEPPRPTDAPPYEPKTNAWLKRLWVWKTPETAPVSV